MQTTKDFKKVKFPPRVPLVIRGGGGGLEENVLFFNIHRPSLHKVLFRVLPPLQNHFLNKTPKMQFKIFFPMH